MKVVVNRTQILSNIRLSRIHLGVGLAILTCETVVATITNHKDKYWLDTFLLFLVTVCGQLLVASYLTKQTNYPDETYNYVRGRNTKVIFRFYVTIAICVLSFLAIIGSYIFSPHNFYTNSNFVPTIFIMIVVLSIVYYKAMYKGKRYDHISNLEIILDGLGDLGSDYHLYSNLRLGRTDVEHLLFTSHGVLLIFVNRHSVPGFTVLSKKISQVEKWFAKRGYRVPTNGIHVYVSSPPTYVRYVDKPSPIGDTKNIAAWHVSNLSKAVYLWEQTSPARFDEIEQQRIENLILATVPEVDRYDILESVVARRKEMNLT